MFYPALEAWKEMENQWFKIMQGDNFKRYV